MTLKAAIVPVTPFEQNCTIVWDDDTMRGTVIDPGGDVPSILAALDQHDVRIDCIVLTHGHLDHAGGADELRAVLTERNGSPVLVEGPHRADAFLLDGIEDQARLFRIEGLRPVVPDRWIEEGETVDIAGHPFAALHCPGHSPGSLVYVNATLGIAFVGDVLFRGSIGRTDFPYGDQSALLDGIARKILPLGDGISFVCGHGPGSTIGEERRSNPFLRGLSRD